jgi:hypothetical protein
MYRALLQTNLRYKNVFYVALSVENVPEIFPVETDKHTDRVTDMMTLGYRSPLYLLSRVHALYNVTTLVDFIGVCRRRYATSIILHILCEQKLLVQLRNNSPLPSFLQSFDAPLWYQVPPPISFHHSSRDDDHGDNLWYLLFLVIFFALTAYI